jgi:hypothetical protein
MNYAVYVFQNPVLFTLNRLLLDFKALIKRFPILARLGRRLAWHWRSLQS